MSTDYVEKAARNKLVFSLHLKIANDWISRNSAGKLFHKYGAAAEKDLSPNVRIDYYACAKELSGEYSI